MPKAPIKPDFESAAQLCAGLLPVWVRHLASSRTQSEAAVHTMLQAFAEMDPGLRQAQQSQQAAVSHEGADTLPSQTGPDLQGLLQQALLPHLANSQNCSEVVHEILTLVQGSMGAFDLGHVSTPEALLSGNPSDTPVDRMYRGLQYQDRISQMMTLLEEDMMRLHKVVSDPQPGTTDLSAWLARLESQYAMAEQRTNHSGESATSGGAASDETTFF